MCDSQNETFTCSHFSAVMVTQLNSLAMKQGHENNEKQGQKEGKLPVHEISHL